MQKRETPKAIPRRPDGTPNPIYFELELEGLPAQWFRVPNARIVAELISLLATFSSVDDSVSFEGSIDILAAFVGVAWADPDIALETPKPGRGGDWLEYGEAVLEELHEAGLGGASHVARWAAELAKRFGAALVSPERLQTFGEAQKDSAILSDWTSA